MSNDIDIDWSQAPEGATHYNQNNEIFYRYKSGVLQSFMFGSWSDSQLMRSLISDLIERPSSPAWNGEGLPPVGVVCEALWNESRKVYLRTKVFGANEHGQPIHRWDEGPKKFEYQADPLVTILGSKVFRPIRTPEQIAAEERESAVCRMIDVAAAIGISFIDADLMRALYDAGYRKMEQPK